MTVSGEAPLKTCPMCAEDIKAEAVVCRYCGYDYETKSMGRVSMAGKTNGLAVASMVLGILWIYWLGSILAIVFGHISLSQIKKSNGIQTGRGMAIAGLVLGYLGVVTMVLILGLVIVGVFLDNDSNAIGDGLVQGVEVLART